MTNEIRRRARLDGTLSFPELDLIQELKTMESQEISQSALEALVTRFVAVHGGLSTEGQKAISAILNQ